MLRVAKSGALRVNPILYCFRLYATYATSTFWSFAHLSSFFGGQVFDDCEVRLCPAVAHSRSPLTGVLLGVGLFWAGIANT